MYKDLVVHGDILAGTSSSSPSSFSFSLFLALFIGFSFCVFFVLLLSTFQDFIFHLCVSVLSLTSFLLVLLLPIFFKSFSFFFISLCVAKLILSCSLSPLSTPLSFLPSYISLSLFLPSVLSYSSSPHLSSSPIPLTHPYPHVRKAEPKKARIWESFFLPRGLMVSCKNGGSMGRVIRESSAHPSNYGRIPADGRLLGCGELEGEWTA